jgi:hypothetical protein
MPLLNTRMLGRSILTFGAGALFSPTKKDQKTAPLPKFNPTGNEPLPTYIPLSGNCSCRYIGFGLKIAATCSTWCTR